MTIKFTFDDLTSDLDQSFTTEPTEFQEPITFDDIASDLDSQFMVQPQPVVERPTYTPPQFNIPQVKPQQPYEMLPALTDKDILPPPEQPYKAPVVGIPFQHEESGTTDVSGVPQVKSRELSPQYTKIAAKVVTKKTPDEMAKILKDVPLDERDKIIATLPQEIQSNVRELAVKFSEASPVTGLLTRTIGAGLKAVEEAQLRDIDRYRDSDGKINLDKVEKVLPGNDPIQKSIQKNTRNALAKIKEREEKTGIPQTQIGEKAKDLFKIADILDPVELKALNIKERIDALKKNNPAYGKALERGDLSYMIDQAIGDYTLAGDAEKADLFVNLQKQYRQAIATDPTARKSMIKSVLTQTIEMLPPLVKSGAKQVLIPGVGSALSFYDWMRQGTGMVMADLRNAGVDFETAKQYAPLAGAIYSGIEYTQFGQLKDISKIAPDKLSSSVIAGVIVKHIKEKGIDALKESGEEGLQQIVTDVSTELAKVEGEKSDKTTGKIVWDAVVNGLKTTAASLPSMGILSILGAGAGAGRDIVKKGAEVPAAQPAPSVPLQKKTPPAPAVETPQPQPTVPAIGTLQQVAAQQPERGNAIPVQPAPVEPTIPAAAPVVMAGAEKPQTFDDIVADLDAEFLAKPEIKPKSKPSEKPALAAEVKKVEPKPQEAPNAGKVRIDEKPVSEGRTVPQGGRDKGGKNIQQPEETRRPVAAPQKEKGIEPEKKPYEMIYNELKDKINPSNLETLKKARPYFKEIFPEFNENYDPWGIYNAQTRDEIPRIPTVDLSQRHKKIIEKAIKAGENIPPAVLKEYPELKVEPPALVAKPVKEQPKKPPEEKPITPKTAKPKPPEVTIPPAPPLNPEQQKQVDIHDYPSKILSKRFLGGSKEKPVFTPEYEALAPAEKFKAVQEEKKLIDAKMAETKSKQSTTGLGRLDTLKARLTREMGKYSEAAKTKARLREENLDTFAATGKVTTNKMENVKDDVEEFFTRYKDSKIEDLNKFLKNQYSEETLKTAVEAIKKGEKDGKAAEELRKEVGGHFEAGINPADVLEEWNASDGKPGPVLNPPKAEEVKIPQPAEKPTAKAEEPKPAPEPAAAPTKAVEKPLEQKIEPPPSPKEEVKNVSIEGHDRAAVEGGGPGLREGVEEARTVGKEAGRGGGEGVRTDRTPDINRPEPDRGTRAGVSGRIHSSADAGAEVGSRGDEPALTATNNDEGTQQRFIDYLIEAADEIGQAGPAQKITDNISAIKTLKKIEAEKRWATPEEQKVLVKYVGWGMLSEVFKPDNKHYSTIKELLLPGEYRAAARSTLNAHYTSPIVIQSVWAAIVRLGFNGGNVLEPAIGIGHFFGLRPTIIKMSMSGIEMDKISGKIARQLYQNADISIQGYETVKMPKDYYQLMVSNVPFLEEQDSPTESHDVKTPGIDKKYALHDFYFLKSLYGLRPGGVIAFITSRYTMDKGNEEIRKLITDQADFIGAVRLPGTAFKKNAGTEVVTDVIFLQKRYPGAKQSQLNDEFRATTEIQLPLVKKEMSHNIGEMRDTRINSYYISHPDMVIGSHDLSGTMYGPNKYNVTLDKNITQEEFKNILDNVFKTFPENIIAPYQEKAAQVEYQKGKVDTDELKNLPTGAYYTQGKDVFQKTSHNTSKKIEDANKDKVYKLVKIKETLNTMYTAQRMGEDKTVIDKHLLSLNNQYDNFVKNYGALNERKNNVVKEDPEAMKLLSLENWDESKKEAKKADVFKGITFTPVQEVKKADNPQDGLIISLNKYGYVNIPFIAELTEKTTDEVIKKLTDDGLIFKSPEEFINGKTVYYIERNEYLSGNVRKKLENAQKVVKKNPEFENNVLELTKIIPVDKPKERISIRLNSPILKTDDVREFIFELIGGKIVLVHNTSNGQWNLEVRTSNYSALNRDYGTERFDAVDILRCMLNGNKPMVYDTSRNPDGSTTRIYNEAETAKAVVKEGIIAKKFREWVWSDEERTARLVRDFNDRFNSFVERQYIHPQRMKNKDAEIFFPNSAFPYPARPHQSDAVWRQVQSRRVMLAHEVGSGKTLEMIWGGQECKRLGLVKKPCYVFPNHMVKQWAGDYYKAYPAANILVAQEGDLSKENRAKFINKAAMNNYDAILIKREDFLKIPLSPTEEANQYEYIIANFREFVETMDKESSKTRTVKEMQKKLASYEEKIKKLRDRANVEKGVLYFEDIAVDMLFVDEADEYKNLAFFTSLKNVKGLGTQAGSKRAMDLYMKLRYLEKKGGRVVFATGTPISNTLVEAYTMMRFLQPEWLHEEQIESFDDWRRLFAEATTEMEPDNTGSSYKPTTRFSKLTNPGSLMSAIRQVWDVATGEMLEDRKILVPGENLPHKKIENAAAPVTDMMKSFKRYLLRREADLKGQKPEEGMDNVLVIIDDGKKAAVDFRLFNSSLPDLPDSKLNIVVRNAFNIYKKYEKQKYTQILFLENSRSYHKLPSGKTEVDFDANLDMKNKLIAMGVKPEEIADIRDKKYESATAKANLFADMRAGRVRILLGSVKKMGAGTNIQTLGKVIHQIDAKWRPRDFDQSNGRFVRQGNKVVDYNENGEVITAKGKIGTVTIYNYVTKGSIDTGLWNMLEVKSKSIKKLMKNEDLDYEIEEDYFGSVKDLSIDDPVMKEAVSLRYRIKELESLQNAWIDNRARLLSDIKSYPAYIKHEQQNIDKVKKSIDKRTPELKGDDFKIEIDGVEYTKRKEAGEKIIAMVRAENIDSESVRVPIGHYAGFPITASVRLIRHMINNKEQYLPEQINIGAQLETGYQYDSQPYNGTNPVSLIMGLHRALYSELDNELKKRQNKLAVLEKSLSDAKEKVNIPFAEEAELNEKQARVKEVDAILSGRPVEPYNPELDKWDWESLKQKLDIDLSDKEEAEEGTEPEGEKEKGDVDILFSKDIGFSDETEDLFKETLPPPRTPQQIEIEARQKATKGGKPSTTALPLFEGGAGIIGGTEQQSLFSKGEPLTFDTNLNSIRDAVSYELWNAADIKMSETFGIDDKYSFSQQEKGGPRVSGATWKDQNGFHITLNPNLKPDAVSRVVVHELMGHIGITSVLKQNKAVYRRLTDLYKIAKNTEAVFKIRRNYKKELDVNPEKAEDIVFSEWIAYAMEDHITNSKKKGIGYQVWMAIRKFLIDMGIPIGNLDDVMYAIAKDLKTIKNITPTLVTSYKSEDVYRKNVANQAILQEEFDATAKQYGGTEAYDAAKVAGKTKLNYQQWVLVRTPRFKAWFGDWENNPASASKVVDSVTGEPAEVFHGSMHAGFAKFEPQGKEIGGGPGYVFFTSDRNVAKTYSGQGEEAVIKDRYKKSEPAAGGYRLFAPGYKMAIYSNFLNIRNPVVENFEGAYYHGGRIDQYEVVDAEGNNLRNEKGERYFKSPTAERLQKANPGSEIRKVTKGFGKTTDSIAEEALKAGHDGAIMKNVVDTGTFGGESYEPVADIFIIGKPEQAKSSLWNTGEYGPDNPDMRYSTQTPVDSFFSPTLRAVQSLKQERGTGDQMFNMIVKAPGVKEAEWKWMGLDDFLKEKPIVTRQEIEEFVRQNQLNLKEIVKGDWKDFGKLLTDEERTEFERLDVIDSRGGLTETQYNRYIELGRIESEAIRRSSDQYQKGTKFSQYTLPGGENYREVLLTLPTTVKKTDEHIWKNIKFKSETEAEKYYDDFNKTPGAYLADIGYGDIRFENNQIKTTHVIPSVKYKSSHWDEPNVIAHIRMNDRTDPDEGKVLFIEEIQSDWAREAREKGIQEKGTPDIAKWTAERSGENFWDVFDENGMPVKTVIAETIDGAIEKAARWNKIGVPNQPFFKNWTELVLKRILRMAAEEGYDRVAWINGQQTADRYDLSKQVDKITWNQQDKTLYVMRNGEKVIDENNVDEKNLASYIGKDAAQKLVDKANAEPGFAPSIEGKDLKIGGEWALNLYDVKIPQFLEKYGKKWGAKVETIKIEQNDVHGRTLVSLGEKMPSGVQQSIRITEPMRQSVMYEGQPMFAKDLLSLNEEAAIRESEQKFAESEANLLAEEEMEEGKRLEAIYNQVSNPKYKLEKSYRKVPDKILANALVPVSTRLKHISPVFKEAMRQFEYAYLQQQKDDMKAVEPFLKAYEKMEKADQKVFDMALKNSDEDKVGELIKKYNLENEYRAIRDVLDGIHARATNAGFGIRYLKDYWPKKVLDYGGLLKYVSGTAEGGVIEKLFQKAEIRLKRPLSEKEKCDIVNLYTGRAERIINVPGATKKRSIRNIDTGMDTYYDQSVSALVTYIHDMDEQIEVRKFLGMDKTAKEEAAKRARRIASPETSKEDLERLVAEDFVDHKINDLTAGIDKYVLDALQSGTLKPEQQDELIGLFRARFNYHPSGKTIQTIKDLSLIAAMGSGFSSCFTQIGDLAAAYYTAGPVNATIAAYWAIARKSKVKRVDVGLDRIAEEFRTSRGLGPILNRIFKVTALNAFDNLGKETLMNANLMKYQAQARKNNPQLIQMLKTVFKDEFQQVLSDLKQANITPNVKYLLFSKLLDFQPMTPSEMPVAYLKFPNGRIFYSLKSYTIKQLDAFRNESVDVIMEGVKENNNWKIGRGLLNLAHLTFLYMLAGAGADAIKDFIFRRKASFGDRVYENILRIFGISRYIIWDVRRQGPISAAVKMISPPTNIVELPFKDMIEWSKESEDPFWTRAREMESWQMIPVVGKHYYWWLGKGAKEQHERTEKKIGPEYEEFTTISNRIEGIRRHYTELKKTDPTAAQKFRDKHITELRLTEKNWPTETAAMTTRINAYQKEVAELKEKRKKFFDEGNMKMVEEYNRRLKDKSTELRNRIKNRLEK